MRQLLELPVRPRISVVDEANIALLRPGDRRGLGVDEALSDARAEREQERSGSG